MKRQNGYVWVRCFLIGILVCGTVVDHAAARKLFRGGSCCRKCHLKCIEACPTACPAPISADCGERHDGEVIADSACQSCAAEMPSEYVPATVVEELAVPTPAPVELSGPMIEYTPAVETLESPIESPSYQPSLPPAPVAVPKSIEINPPASTAPTVVEPPIAEPPVVEPPAAEVVGDRYSNNDELFGPASPADYPSPPVDNAGNDDLFDEPAPPAEEDDTSETPLPIPLPDPEPEPQTKLNDGDLFGPANAEQPAEPDVSEENEAEPAEQPQDAEPPAPEPDESYDPFAENLTRLDTQSTVLKKAGGLQSKAERTWTDNTATFECQARLLRVTAKSVILQQSTGAKLVVPFARLANNDLQFVHGQVTALRVARAQNAAAEKLAVAWAK